MKRSSRQKIDRDDVIDAALGLANRYTGEGSQPITGARIGSVLDVDRSAVWRHFQDQDALFGAVCDRALAPLVETQVASEPWSHLEKLFRGLIGVCRKYPTLAQELMGVPSFGRNWQELSESVLLSLDQLGLRTDQAARYFRVSFEFAMGYGISLAVYELRPEAVRNRDLASMKLELEEVEPEEFPHLAAAGPTLVQLDPETTTDLVVDALHTLLEAYRSAGVASVAAQT